MPNQSHLFLFLARASSKPALDSDLDEVNGQFEIDMGRDETVDITCRVEGIRPRPTIRWLIGECSDQRLVRLGQG